MCWLSCGLDDGGIRVQLLAGVVIFLFFTASRLARDQAACCPLGTKGPFPGSEETEAWSWPITSINAKVKNTWSCISSALCVFIN